MVHEKKNETEQTQSKKLKESLKELKEGLSFGLFNKPKGRQNNDLSVSLAAASCCSSGADPWDTRQNDSFWSF
jgi:hypothetical protein